MSLSIPNPVQSAALAHPDACALPGMSWRALRDQVARRAGRFSPGEVVALDGPQDAGWIVWSHAIGWAGAILAPLPEDPAARARALSTLAPDRIVDSRSKRIGPTTPERPWALDAVRVRLTTSGTTGTPKVVDLTTAQICFSAMGSMLRLGHLPGDRWLDCLPLHHVGGLAILYRAAWGAACVERAAFDPAAIAARLDSGAVQLASLTPAMLAAVLDARAEAPFPAGLRALLIGGAALPPDLAARCERLGAPVHPTWGMSEAGSQICTDGVPLAFARVQTRGEALVVSGPIAPGGHLVTADRGRVHPDGQVEVFGRRDDVIISGGENLDPAAIEAALCTHPAVDEAVVIGRPHPRWGARPVAICVGDGAADDALRALCRAQVHRFAAPDAIYWWPALPRTGPLGKLSRSVVARQLEARLAHGGVEFGGAVERAQVGQPPEGVLERDRAVIAEVVAEGHRAAGAALDGGDDLDGPVVPHGLAVVGLDVHQRHGQAQVVEGLRAVEAGEEQLLEADVGVLERTPEEDDADPIHLVEPRRDDVAKTPIDLSGHQNPLDEAIR